LQNTAQRTLRILYCDAQEDALKNKIYSLALRVFDAKEAFANIFAKTAALEKVTLSQKIELRLNYSTTEHFQIGLIL